MKNKLIMIGVAASVGVVVAYVIHKVTSIKEYNYESECEGCTGCDEECDLDTECESCNNTECCCNPVRREHILDM